MIGRSALAVTVALALGGCERAGTQLDAAQDVRAFIVASREGDRATFDRHVDRAALTADLRRQIVAQPGAAGAARLFESEQGRQLLDRLIAPETFAFALDRAGPALQRTPTTPEIAAVLRVVDGDTVCLPQGGLDGPCAASFDRQGDTWRLTALNGAGAIVQQIPFPPAAAG